MFILDGACGSIPPEITNTIGQIYNILLIAIPVMIVLFALIDLAKGVIGSKEDEIKKSTGALVKRLITGLIAFFILALVKFGISLLQTDNTSGVVECLNSIFGNNSENE